MIAAMNEVKPGMHPHKYVLWIALVSIVMMFAGLTSAVIVKRNQANWLSFDIPLIFWYSTAIILVSSVTIILARKAFIERRMAQYKSLMLATTVLGILFVIMQYMGFVSLWENGITITRNVAFSFLYVIVGIHALHVIGGVIALLIVWLRAGNRHRKEYTTVPIDVLSTYWHFVDILWIYLLVFLMIIG